jgi:transmembrane 9 superfamily protein 3
MRFADRFDRYLDFDFFENQIHWFSVFNAFTMVLFLCGLVVLILLRTLRNDYARYSKEDDDMELDNVVDQSGWKQVHADANNHPYPYPYINFKTHCFLPSIR